MENIAETELTKMEKNLGDINSEMTKSQSPLEKLTNKIFKQENELKALQIQYKNVVLEQSKNSSEAKELAGQIKDLNGDIKENKDKLNEAEIAPLLAGLAASAILTCAFAGIAFLRITIAVIANGNLFWTSRYIF